MKQLVRYSIVGLASNLIGYLAYLLLTFFQVGPKLAMTLVYVAGASAGYLGNRLWTFSHKGKALTTLLKYGLAHSCGYLLNFSILYIFVDRMSFPHQIVQAVAIVVVASFLFLVFKKIIFVETKPNPPIPSK